MSLSVSPQGSAFRFLDLFKSLPDFADFTPVSVFAAAGLQGSLALFVTGVCVCGLTCL